MDPRKKLTWLAGASLGGAALLLSLLATAQTLAVKTAEASPVNALFDYTNLPSREASDGISQVLSYGCNYSLYGVKVTPGNATTKTRVDGYGSPSCHDFLASPITSGHFTGISYKGLTNPGNGTVKLLFYTASGTFISDSNWLAWGDSSYTISITTVKQVKIGFTTGAANTAVYTSFNWLQIHYVC